MPVVGYHRTKKRSKLTAIGWGLLILFAIGTGLQGLRYALPTVPFPAPLPNFATRHGWLITHAVFSSIALLSGPWQFLSSFRHRFLAAHRWLGRVYCGAVVVGWLSSLPIAAHAQTGKIASAGFLILGALWMGTTTAGYLAIRQGHVSAHGRSMLRSYVLTAAAITLRLYLPILMFSGVPFVISYPLVAWFCWIPNLLFAEWLVHRRSPTVRHSSIQPAVL